MPAPYHHRLPLSAQAWHGAQSVSLSWPTPHGPSSPAALPWDHLLPCSLVHGDARSPAASLVGSLLYLGPLTADGDNPSRGLGLNPSFSCPHRPGEVLADQMNQQYTDHSSASLTPSCCAVWVCKEPAALGCLQCMVGVCVLQGNTQGKEWDNCTTHQGQGQARQWARLLQSLLCCTALGGTHSGNWPNITKPMLASHATKLPQNMRECHGGVSSLTTCARLYSPAVGSVPALSPQLPMPSPQLSTELGLGVRGLLANMCSQVEVRGRVTSDHCQQSSAPAPLGKA